MCAPTGCALVSKTDCVRAKCFTSVCRTWQPSRNSCPRSLPRLSTQHFLGCKMAPGSSPSLFQCVSPKNGRQAGRSDGGTRANWRMGQCRLNAECRPYITPRRHGDQCDHGDHHPRCTAKGTNKGRPFVACLPACLSLTSQCATPINPPHSTLPPPLLFLCVSYLRPNIHVYKCVFQKWSVARPAAGNIEGAIAGNFRLLFKM